MDGVTPERIARELSIEKGEQLIPQGLRVEFLCSFEWGLEGWAALTLLLLTTLEKGKLHILKATERQESLGNRKHVSVFSIDGSDSMFVKFDEFYQLRRFRKSKQPMRCRETNQGERIDTFLR